jgi:hypothetical protein
MRFIPAHTKRNKTNHIKLVFASQAPASKYKNIKNIQTAKTTVLDMQSLMCTI